MRSKGAGRPPGVEAMDSVREAPASYVEVDVTPDLGFDDVPDLAFDATSEEEFFTRPRETGRPRRVPSQAAAGEHRAMSVCLSCGQSPPERGDCPHEEIAHLTAAGGQLVATARKLAAAVAEHHAHARALRRLVGLEVAAGRGEIAVSRPPLATGTHSVDESSGRVSCAHGAASVARRARSRRRPPPTEAQGVLPFIEKA
jgi:hypothetical protein